MSNGLKMPLIGMGTLNLGTEEEQIEAIRLAIRSGYRFFDCAWVYGNEEIVGRGLKLALEDSKGAVKREDIFIITKVWNTHHSRAMARQSTEESLRHLQLDYIDLMLIHWPTGFKENTEMGSFPVGSDGHVLDSGIHYMETYHALEELQREGKIKSIGVSNFNVTQLKDVLDNCTIPPVVNEVEVNPYYQNEKLVSFCQANKIAVIGYAPFGVGMRHPEHPDLPLLFSNPVLVRIGHKYGKSAAQTCLKFSVQKNIALIPRSCIEKEVLDNANIFDFELSPSDMEEIKGLNLNIKSDIYKTFVNTPHGKFKHDKHPFYPFNE